MNGKILGFVILIGLITASATPVAGVVINEFEQNPDGVDSGMEWVELYNPLGTEIDIGGWDIVNCDNDVVTIPVNTMIPAGGYWTHTFSGQWLDNSNECIILRDTNDDEMDKTPIKNDGENDDRCWARNPNGQDTDSDSDWVLRVYKGIFKQWNECLRISIDLDSPDNNIGIISSNRYLYK